MNEKLLLLHDNVKLLRKFKEQVPLADVRLKKFDEWALRYGFYETVQLIIDLSCHVVSRNNLGSPKSYGECIAILRKEKMISEPAAKNIEGMIGLRNILAHEYTTVDVELLYRLLDKIGDIEEFILQIKPYL